MTRPDPVAAAYAALPDPLRSILDDIDAGDAFRTVAALTDLGEKLSGSPAEAAACKVITDKLQAWGIAFQLHRFEALISHPVATSLQAPWGEIETAGAGFTASTPASGVLAGVVVCPGNAIDRLDPQQVAGRLLLAQGIPNFGLAKAAQDLGAAGVLFASTGIQCHKTELSPLWGAPSRAEHLERLLRIPVVSIPAADAVRLAGLAPDQQLWLTTEVETAWREILLPVAEIPGRDPRFLLAGAHYCTWYGGATDNASGAAILLEMARVFSQHRDRLNFGIRLAWWPGHEQGEYAGSSWYADTHWMELHERGLAYHNLDIVGVRGGVLKAIRNQTGDLADYTARVVAAFAPPMSETDAAFVARALRREDKYVPANRVARNSDQSFCGIGLSSYQVSAFQTADSPDHLTNAGIAWWWQSAHDTIERCDPAELDRDARINTALAAGILCSTLLPFDLNTLATDLRGALREYHEAAPEDAAIADLVARAAAFAARVAELAPRLSGQDPARVNAALLAVGRQLTPVLYHADSRFAYDHSRRNRSLPGLAPALTLRQEDPQALRLDRLAILRAANRIALALHNAEAALHSLNEEI